jgi:hypothetical protein
MQNVTVSLSADKKTATIKIKLDEVHGPSKSGKTEIVGTTGGVAQIADTGVYLGVNAFKYPDSK